MSESSRGEKSSKVKEKGKAEGDGDATILLAEAFTHGGVRKVRDAMHPLLSTLTYWEFGDALKQILSNYMPTALVSDEI